MPRKKYDTDFKTKVVLEILKEEKTLSQLASEYGVHVNQLRQWRDLALENWPRAFEPENKQLAKIRSEYEDKIQELYAEVGRLSTQLSWLEKNLASLSREDRLALIDFQERELPLSVQAKLLGLNRSSLYYKPVGPSEEEVRLKHRIDQIYTEHPFYGSRRITAILRSEHWTVNRKAVQRHMREMGIAGITPGPNLSRRAQAHRVYPYLLRGLKIERPNQVWGIDITYIRMAHGWMYLVAILDWYSRYVVSYELDQTLHMDFVLKALDQALEQWTPEIMNSDQGSHFTSPKYTDVLLNHGIQISMDGRGRALDNIFTERLWRSLKQEEVYLHDYQTPKQAREGIARYLEFYNHRRPHQSLGYVTPASVHGL
ncbi:IS3 family transposase [Kyrpidia spormannii]|uniref:IS3 family transposase n=1 Tax=Kyrpidia spormannii TaxID=2055160 RepID=A0A2K8NBI8_9BACL|nr:IS3 family transposase [Kyrpidia spormannii]ATY85822.1 IS3 family transposase [Kyrpidia spormannii]